MSDTSRAASRQTRRNDQALHRSRKHPPADFGQQWVGEPWTRPTRAQEVRFWVLTFAFALTVAIGTAVMAGWFR